MQRSVHRLDASRRDDFYRVHCAWNGAAWCFCVAWWVPTWDGWAQRPALQNRQLRDRLFDSGEYDGYLLYVDDRPVGWCQVGPRDRLQKLVRQFSLEPDPSTWAITCFFIAPSHRGQGLAKYLLDDVLADIRARGAAKVEAFPKRGKRLGPDDLWTGPERTYLEAGFKVVRDDPERPILRLNL
jgi:GNAT superfamily N-acetyltransferase